MDMWEGEEPGYIKMPGKVKEIVYLATKDKPILAFKFTGVRYACMDYKANKSKGFAPQEKKEYILTFAEAT